MFPVLENPQLDTHHDYIGQKYEIIFFWDSAPDPEVGVARFGGPPPGFRSQAFFPRSIPFV